MGIWRISLIVGGVLVAWLATVTRSEAPVVLSGTEAEVCLPGAQAEIPRTPKARVGEWGIAFAIFGAAGALYVFVGFALYSAFIAIFSR
jgi:hypothetical protein